MVQASNLFALRHPLTYDALRGAGYTSSTLLGPSCNYRQSLMRSTPPERSQGGQPAIGSELAVE